MSDFTLFLVGEFAQTSPSYYVAYALTTAPTQYLYAFSAIDGIVADRVATQFEVFRNGVATIGTASVFDDHAIQHVYELHYDGSAAGSCVRLDGAVVVPDATPMSGDAGTSPWSALLYLLSDDTSAYGKAGSIAEARVYPALTLVERQEVERELRTRYPYTPPP